MYHPLFMKNIYNLYHRLKYIIHTIDSNKQSTTVTINIYTMRPCVWPKVEHYFAYIYVY